MVNGVELEPNFQSIIQNEYFEVVAQNYSFTHKVS